jgi:hypothetical protein
MDPIPMSEGARSKVPLWDAGYELSLNIFRISDQIDDKGSIAEHLRTNALTILFELSKVSPKASKTGIKRMRQSLIAAQRLAMLMMFVHDLNYVDTERYLKVNTDINMFSTKLKRVIRYKERKIKNTK